MQFTKKSTAGKLSEKTCYLLFLYTVRRYKVYAFKIEQSCNVNTVKKASYDAVASLLSGHENKNRSIF